METLLDQAEALLASNPEKPPRPDFPLPDGYEEGTPYRFMTLKDSRLKGRGWFASEDISAGTVLICAKPIVMVMDWEDPEDLTSFEEDNDDEAMSLENEASGLSKLNEILLLNLVRIIIREPSIWSQQLNELFPRTTKEIEALDIWVCKDDDVFLQFEGLINELHKRKSLPEEVVKDISKRLPLIVRYNVLSAETSPELMVHPSPEQGYAALSGTCLYHLPSFFNHDARPNASRYAVGDVMWVVANQDILAETEVCISYLEHEVLCEPAKVRNVMLNMDFTEEENNETAEDWNEEEEGPEMPVVDIDIQNELMNMDVMERLEAIESLMLQALGKVSPLIEKARMEGSNQMEESIDSTPWFECDAQNLRILKALTLDSLGRMEESISIWKECVLFCETKLPPNDEALVVILVQAALCAFQQSQRQDEARQLAAQAVAVHSILFGGGIERFRRRYNREFQLALRPTYTASAAQDLLWPLKKELPTLEELNAGIFSSNQ
mmetsp:Transcript_4779/g.7380  ORF Transcript_4779/g.7380 Transcript_4779/m.7380 type:complete len:496 (-) Transcript_4779:83-1570(-)